MSRRKRRTGIQIVTRLESDIISAIVTNRLTCILQQVLDLVHPSLFPVVYGRTYQKTENGVALLPAPGGESDYLSKRFAWLPSDFAVDTDGKVSLQSSYMQVNSFCSYWMTHLTYDIIMKK